MIRPELLASLGGVAGDADPAGFDEIVVAPAHRTRLALMTLQGGVNFGGVKVVPHPAIPAGFGIMRTAGKVVGVMDFSTQQVVLLAKAKT